jgi:hypothetical protein
MYFSQKDKRWANKVVGFGSMTFSQVGCAIVSVANKLKYDGIDMTPLEVNEFAKNCGAFNVNMLNFQRLANALGYDYVKQTKKPKDRQIGETNHYKKVGVPQHFIFLREDGKRIDPLDENPSWEVNNYPIISYRVFKKIKKIIIINSSKKVTKTTQKIDLHEKGYIDVPLAVENATTRLESGKNDTPQANTQTNSIILNNMDTPIKKTVKRFSWQGFSMVLTVIGGLLASEEVRKLIAQYPEAVAILAVVSLVITQVTKVVNNYLTLKKEIKDLT